MIIKKEKEKIKRELQKYNHELIDLQADLIISYVLDIKLELLHTISNEKLNNEQIQKIDNLLIKARTTPIQLILGYTFINKIFLYVNKHTLLPGSETSSLINIAISLLFQKTSLKIVDAGTGSGVISISIAKTIPFNIEKIFAIDKSHDALKIAQKNKEFHNISKIETIQGNWLQPLFEKDIKDIDLLIANPPYVKTHEIHQLDEVFKKNTPSISIDGGKNGLEHFQTIITDAITVLKRRGLLLLQTDEYQTNKVIKIIQTSSCYENIVTFSGTSSMPRFILCEKK